MFVHRVNSYFRIALMKGACLRPMIVIYRWKNARHIIFQANVQHSATTRVLVTHVFVHLTSSVVYSSARVKQERVEITSYVWPCPYLYHVSMFLVSPGVRRVPGSGFNGLRRQLGHSSRGVRGGVCCGQSRRVLHGSPFRTSIYKWHGGTHGRWHL